MSGGGKREERGREAGIGNIWTGFINDGSSLSSLLQPLGARHKLGKLSITSINVFIKNQNVCALYSFL